MAKFASIAGIEPVLVSELRARGIRSTGQLLAKGGTKLGRQTLAAKCGISEASLLRWVSRSDLLRVKGVGAEYSDLLQKSGVTNVVQLAAQHFPELHAACVNLADSTDLVGRLPSLTEVEGWIMSAKRLDPAVSY